MKCIPLLTSLVLIVAMAVLQGCASKSSQPSQKIIATTENDSRESQSKRFIKPATNVSEDVKAQYKKALALLQNGDLLRAEKILKSISSKNPDIAGPKINLGIIAMKEGRWLEAESFLSSAKELSPKNPEVYNYLGVVYRQQGKFDEAKTQYQQAIEADRAYANAYLNLGILFDLYLSDYSMAKKYYQDYQAMVPNDDKVKPWLVDLDHRIRASN